MNPKQTIPLVVALAPAIAAAPAVIVGGFIGLGIILLIKSVDSGNNPAPDTTPAKAEIENDRKTAEITRTEAENPVFREITPIPSAFVPVPSVSVRQVPVATAIVRPVAKIVQPPPPAIPPLVAKKTINRADMATIFDDGKRTMSRLEAVTALKRMGFGKTAAYSATAPDGRFSQWLVYASDGIIYWEENA